MEPNIREEGVKVIDTGQSSFTSSSTTVTATQPLELSAGEGFVNNGDGEDALKVFVSSESAKQEYSDKNVGDFSSTFQSSASLLSDGKEAARNLDSPESVSYSDVSQEDCVKSVETKPKIFIGMEDEDPREIGSSNDEDLDPLITVDDTESQFSDLINFDTVSYDVIHQLGGEDDDDDEKSIATVSSLSCDIKVDSPLHHSQHSNSSSLVNLLDSSMKDSTGIGVCSSTQISAEGMRSTGSTCPSSPVLDTSKTASSVMDENISEECTNLLPENDVCVDACDSTSILWSKAVIENKDASLQVGMEEADLIESECSFSSMKEIKSISQQLQVNQPEIDNSEEDPINLDEASMSQHAASKLDQFSEVNANAILADGSTDQTIVLTTPIDSSIQKSTENNATCRANEICATAATLEQDDRTEPLLAFNETVADSTTTAAVDGECIPESDLLLNCDQNNYLAIHGLSNCLEECLMSSSDQASEGGVTTSTLLVAESYQDVVSDVSVSSPNLIENDLNTLGDINVCEERPSSPGSLFKEGSVDICSKEVAPTKSHEEHASIVDSPLESSCDKREVSFTDKSDNATNLDISPVLTAPLQSMNVNTLNSLVQSSLDEGVSSSDTSWIEAKVVVVPDIPPISKSNEDSTSNAPVQQDCGKDMISSSEKSGEETNTEIVRKSSYGKAYDLPMQPQVCDVSVSSTSEGLMEVISELDSELPALLTTTENPSPNSPVKSNQSLLPELSSSKEATAPLNTANDANATFISSSLVEESKPQEETANLSQMLPGSNTVSTKDDVPLVMAETCKLDVSDSQAAQIARVNSLDHQEKLCEYSEVVMTALSSDSADLILSDENAEVGLLDVIDTKLSELEDGRSELNQTSEEVNGPQVIVGNNNPQDYTLSKTVCEEKTEDCISFQTQIQNSLKSDKILESELSLEVGTNDMEADKVIRSKDSSFEGFPIVPGASRITDEKFCGVEDSPLKLFLMDVAINPSVDSCDCVPNCDSEVNSSHLDRSMQKTKSLDTELPETESAPQCVQICPSAVHRSEKHPTSLPDLKSSTSSPDNLGGMNFSDFLSLMSPASPQKTTIGKQYSVTALDEAQQTACYLVDDVLQEAVLKVEKMISSHTFICDNAVKTAQLVVSDILIKAEDGVQIIAADERKDYFKDSSEDKTMIQELGNQISQDPFNGNAVLEMGAISSFDDKKVLLISDLKEDESSLPSTSTPSETEPKQVQSVTDSVTKGDITLSNTSSEIELVRFSSDITSSLVQESSNNSQAEDHSKDELARTPSPETIASDSARSSLLTSSDLGLRSEASLFVDGVLEEAAKKYEESSSSESSPIKLKSLLLDSEYQDDEELATPCGEMLTEHFMDFESGRNVSVFCSISESGPDDDLMAYDRVANTIGNREVDSDTGKSLSVFRIEEDVFYEIQRASTCTSVFESVEEEDEDMVDTTIPVEDRYDLISQTSVSSSECNTDNQNVSGEHFRTDNDAFEDAVGAFLTKERQTQDEGNQITSEEMQDNLDQQQECSQLVRRNPCRALVLRHPEYDLSNQEEKKKMAEKWANGGESTVPDTPEMHQKQRAIREALDSDEDAADVAVKLCQLALTEGGLINDALRKEAWPRMLGLDPSLEIDVPSLDDLKEHPEYGQVVLDVNRSLKRFPPDIPKDRRETLQDKLTRLIMYVISKHPHLRYYQGYHDVAVTFLLVVGESVAFQIMERLSTENLSDCMQPTMERTSYLLHFIYPLLHRLHPTLADYLERSEVGTMFCLPWFLTWFGHSLDRYQDVVRLYDHFLASPPLAPLYVAAVLVAHRADEVLAVDCDMAAIHALLSHIPDTLPLEILLRDATDLYLKFPPESIESEVEERFKNEQEMRVHEVEAREKLQRQRALRRRRGHSTGSGSWQLAEFQDRVGGGMMVLNRWMPPWVVQQQRLSMRLLFASATFFVGFYVYSRSGEMLPYL